MNDMKFVGWAVLAVLVGILTVGIYAQIDDSGDGKSAGSCYMSIEGGLDFERETELEEVGADVGDLGATVEGGDVGSTDVEEAPTTTKPSVPSTTKPTLPTTTTVP
jgi:hypothetical protein